MLLKSVLSKTLFSTDNNNGDIVNFALSTKRDFEKFARLNPSQRRRILGEFFKDAFGKPYYDIFAPITEKTETKSRF